MAQALRLTIHKCDHKKMNSFDKRHNRKNCQPTDTEKKKKNFSIHTSNKWWIWEIYKELKNLTSKNQKNNKWIKIGT